MILVRVITLLSRGWWRVVVGSGVGQLDGGAHQDWPEDWVPTAARFPNAEFWISGFADGRPQISVPQGDDSDIADDMLKETKPFYQRKRFGLF